MQDNSERKVTVVYHGHIYGQSHVYVRESCTGPSTPLDMAQPTATVNRGAHDEELQDSESCAGAIEAGPFMPQEMVVIGQFVSQFS